MRSNLGWLAAVAVLAGCGGGAPETQTSPPATGAYGSPATSAPMGATSGEFAAEVVAVDAAARTLTVREVAVGGTAATTDTATTGATAPGGTTTLSVDAAAAGSLGDLKTGDSVVVSCTMGGATGMGMMVSPSPAGAPGTMMGSDAALAGGALSGCTMVTAIRKAN